MSSWWESKELVKGKKWKWKTWEYEKVIDYFLVKLGDWAGHRGCPLLACACAAQWSRGRRRWITLTAQPRASGAPQAGCTVGSYRNQRPVRTMQTQKPEFGCTLRTVFWGRHTSWIHEPDEYDRKVNEVLPTCPPAQYVSELVYYPHSVHTVLGPP